jgi:tRNA uridine 5-carboxymethylaminomethyl modification enzyme
VAGLNAAAKAGGGAPAIFDRAEGYLGVMIDDLVTRGVSEPYRMFTSRAEYRLTLRADNADQRLTDKGIALGCIGTRRAGAHRTKMALLDAARAMARLVTVTPTQAAKYGISLRRDGQRRTAFELLSYPDLSVAHLSRIWPELADLEPRVAEQLEIDAKCDVYLGRQAADVESYRRDESLVLDDDLDFDALAGLSNEVRHKLQSHRPRTVGQASRIDGMTPAALTLLVAHIRRRNRKPNSKPNLGAA